MAVQQNEYNNICLERQAQPYVEKGMNILNKYAELYNRVARHSCHPNYEILANNYVQLPLNNNYVQLPLNEIEVDVDNFNGRRMFVPKQYEYFYNFNGRRMFVPKQYEYFYNLTILFSIEYKQDINNSATFNWVNGNKYYGSIDESFRNEFGNLYHGFSNPIFIKEDNCYKTNHSQTFKMQTIIEIEKKLTKDEAIKIMLELEESKVKNK